MADEDLTQRERRAQRHRETRRSGSGGGGASRSVRRALPFILVILAVGVVAGAAVYFKNSTQGSGQCVTQHWHATFGLFVPGPDGAPVRVDFAAPKTADGHPYYDFTSTNYYGGAPGFSAAVHMHQDAANPETGGATLGAAQLHMEQAGTCTGLRTIFKKLDVEVGSDSLTLKGGHTQVQGQSGTFSATGNQTLTWWLQTHDGCNSWVWHEKPWSEIGSRQIQDGESLLGALGHYSEEQVRTMQSQVPAPSSRVGSEKGCSSSSAAPTSTAQ